VASAAADVSDGLLGDLGHILKQSSVGATVDTSVAMHLLAAYADPADVNGQFDQEQWMALALRCVLAGGDDYELVFTAPVSRRKDVAAAALQGDVPVTRLGRIDAAPGLRLVNADGAAVENRFASFDHFAEPETAAGCRA
jgi:thiamine-monophosphate kinase